MFNAGIANYLAIIVVTAQSTSHLTEPSRARETPAGCRPRARGTDVNNAFSQQLPNQEITCPDTPMERSHVKEKLRGLYLPGFLGGSPVMWLIDTGAARSVL